jgi:hypothetical protein
MDASTPMTRVTPKPRTGPEARKNSRPAASSVVTLESAIALNALAKPLSSGGHQPLAARGGVLLPGALEDEHVRVDREPADSSRPPSPGRRERRAEGDERAVRDAARTTPSATAARKPTKR